MVHAPYKQMLVMYLSCGTQMGSASVQQHEMWSTSGLCTCDKTERYQYYFLTLRLHTKSNQQKKKEITNISRGTECALHFSTFLGNMGHSQLPTGPSHGPRSVVFAVTLFCCGKLIYENNLCRCYLTSSPQFLHFKDEKNPSFNILNKTVRNISHITDSSGFHLSVNFYNCTVQT